MPRWWLGAMVMVMAFGGPAAAVASASLPQQFALLICNDDYDRDGRIVSDTPPNGRFMPDLVRPCQDMATIEAALAPYDFNMVKATNLDRGGIDATIHQFAAGLAASPLRSTVFVYYAGHGAQFDGDVYGVPVLYQPGGGAAATDFAAKRQFLLKNANLWSSVLSALPDRPDLAVAIVIDACRNNPFAEATIYNEANVPRGPNNEFVFWATNGGNTATDSGALARIVADAFHRGGTISEVMSTVWRRDGELFDAGKAQAEGEPWTGRSFAFQKQPVLRRRIYETYGQTRAALWPIWAARGKEVGCRRCGSSQGVASSCGARRFRQEHDPLEGRSDAGFTPVRRSVGTDRVEPSAAMLGKLQASGTVARHRPGQAGASVLPASPPSRRRIGRR